MTDYEKITAAFDCVICGNKQEIPGGYWGKQICFPVCDECKRTLLRVIQIQKLKDDKKSDS